MDRTCLCGCGRPVRHRLYARGHSPGHCKCGRPTVSGRGFYDCPCHDERAIAYYAGAADARNGRPRSVDRADTSMLGDAYTRGYDATARKAALA